ncbi:MAG: 2-isopropylmalate synthase, partial [Cryomorphaceae bacterium]
MMARTIEIMDTTLRDGEQTPGVSFTAIEKLTLAKLLLTELKVDRIEIASARVSAGEFAAVKSIAEWAAANNCLEKIEVLTFLDKGASLDWMEEAGTCVQNLLTKGSLNHLTHQLRKTPEQHFSAVAEIIASAKEKGIETNVYLEDWSNGMRNSREYVFEYLDFLVSQPIKRILLPDTLGILSPAETFSYLQEIVERYPETHFDFHGHNDYGLSVANVMEALRAGCHGIHLTVNGMGERAGNAPLASCIAVINDFMPEIHTNVDEIHLYDSSKTVSSFSGFTIPVNKPVVGANVFTQTAGIHADGDSKH